MTGVNKYYKTLTINNSINKYYKIVNRDQCK